MSKLPLDQAIQRIQQNDERMDRFANGGDTETFTTSGGVVVPSFAKFVKDHDAQLVAFPASLAASGGATLVGNAPSGTISASTVQAAINELDTEKVGFVSLAANNGSSFIGKGVQIVDSIVALRALLKTSPSKYAHVTGYYGPLTDGGGLYILDLSDVSSADNGGSIIVATDGGRWKLQHFGSVTVKQFGAKGDGVTDDYAAIQAALTFIGLVRGVNLWITSGKYNISAQLVFMAANVPAALSGSDLHFSEHVESQIIGSGDARLIATAAMTRMLLIQPNTATSSIAPFYTLIQGITFDCNNLASSGIDSNFAMNLSIIKNKIWRPTANGITYTGYGVAKIRDNVIKAPICINFSGGGGDSDISSNDFYPLASGAGVKIGALGGDASIRANVFNGEGFTGCNGVYLDGAGAGASNSVINVRILDNEFSGMASSVYGQRHASSRNIFGIQIRGNHIIPAAGGAVHTGQLANLNGVDDVIISDNHINGLGLAVTLTSAPGILLSDCRRPMISKNKFGNLLGPAAYMTNVVNGEFSDNEINDVGQSGAGGVIVDVDTGTTGLVAIDNILRQSNASYAQNPFFERTGANGNEFLRNHIFGCSNRITRVGATSVVSGRVVASGAYSLTGAVATLQTNSHGFTVSRTAAGVCTVTLATARPNSAYRVKVNSDAPQIAIDTYTNNTFIVRTFNSAGTALDAAFVQVEVTD